MCYNEEWIEEDMILGPQKRTTRVIHSILNSICSYLTFTTEDHEDFESKKLPTLDCQIWVENEKILYDFFEKPQVPNRTLQEGTALSRTSLEASLVQEGVRRLLNTSPLVNKESRTATLNAFARKLINSGFDTDTAQRLLINSAACFVDIKRICEIVGPWMLGKS